MYNILYTSSPSHSKIYGTGVAQLPGKELQWQFRKRGEAAGRMGLQK